MAHSNLQDKSTSEKPPKLLDQVRDKLRVNRYSIRTEQTYVGWIKRFILFHGKRHPKDMEARDVEAFLTHLAVVGKVAASTQFGSDASCIAHSVARPSFLPVQ